MREGIRSFLILAALLVSGSAAFCQQTITLENSELKVTLSAENATVMSVIKKQTNTSYLGSSEQSGWFKVQIPLPNWDGHTAGSRNLKSVTIKKRGMDSVEIRTNLLRAEDSQYAVPIELVLRLEGENLVCRLKLQNNTKQTIDRVTFPILGVPPAAARTEAILMPNLIWPLGMVFSITVLCRIEYDSVKLRAATTAKAGGSHQPGLDLAENLFPRHTRSFFGYGHSASG